MNDYHTDDNENLTHQWDGDQWEDHHAGGRGRKDEVAEEEDPIEDDEQDEKAKSDTGRLSKEYVEVMGSGGIGCIGELDGKDGDGQCKNVPDGDDFGGDEKPPADFLSSLATAAAFR